jgi:hypothetical protein
VEKEREYLKKLLDTQKVIFDILIALLRNPVEEKTTNYGRIYRPYSNYQRDEKALALCLFEQDKYAQSHGFKIRRFGPERRPIRSVKDVFRWCVDIAREYGPTFIEGADREKCWQWYERLLRWETDIPPPEWLLKIKLGLSGPILLFIGIGEHYAITADTRGMLYRQLEEIRARVKTFHHVAVGIPAEGFGAKGEVNTIQAKGILDAQKTPASQAEDKGQVTFQYNKKKTEEGSEIVVNGILIGEKGKHLFTRIPALAFAEYARASNAGIKDTKDIEKRVIDRIPSWRKYKKTGKEPNTKYVKREIKKGIKIATNHAIIPFNPIPFHVDLPKSR